jgi:hypothetical protein
MEVYSILIWYFVFHKSCWHCRNAILRLFFTVDGKEVPVREVSRTRGTSVREQQQVSTVMLDVSGSGVSIYGSRQQQAPAIGQSLQNVDTGRDGKRGVLSQLIEKVLRANIYVCKVSCEWGNSILLCFICIEICYCTYLHVCIVLWLYFYCIWNKNKEYNKT